LITPIQTLYVKKDFQTQHISEAYPTMPSNVIHLNVELEAREHRRKLTPKQEMTIRLRGCYATQSRLIKALSFHKLAYKKRSQEFIEVTERIKIHEEKLML
jgi:hypothetical protein